MHKLAMYLLVSVASAACRTGKPPLAAGQSPPVSRIVQLEREPFAVDTICPVSVQTIDLETREPIGNVVVLFTKSNSRVMVGVVTRLEDGGIERRLKPDVYDLEARFTGKQTLLQPKLTFEAGWRYRLKLGLADNRSEPSHRH